MIIYKATNKINGKCYIGQTIRSLKNRVANHKHSSIKGSNLYFHRAIRKYGIENFFWEVLCQCETQEELNEMEFHYIKQYHSQSIRNGYNTTEGFDNTTTGYKFTEDQLKYYRERIKTRRYVHNQLFGDKNPSKRPEVREKISKSKIGKPRPDIEIYRSKCYVIVFLDTNEEIIIYNLSKWVRENPTYSMPSIKNVISGKWSRTKNIWIKRIE